MPHADSALVPKHITAKSDFWALVADQLDALLEPKSNWVSALANAASLIYSALAAFPAHFGTGERAVNWCGFYLESSHFPGPFIPPRQRKDDSPVLLLGPFCGKPACQLIVVHPGRGVCADAYASGSTVRVADVETYPGHIACDGDTRAEIVVPLVVAGCTVGVLDLDCLAPDAFDADDQAGLERIARIVASRAVFDLQ
ncbi:GAF domain-like protein [Auricularia subglabra TFB-10046 SS5]|nr:GAF domain-like protein [Auricularia subglabra TFB-10046 SS5]